MQKKVVAAAQEYRRKRKDLGAKAEWIKENFLTPAQNLLEEYGKLEQSIRRGTFYEPLSMQEMTDIVKGLDFGHAGHFYKCPNGHTFVITECGGATQESICPECGARIGGSDHRLLATNTRDTEFEQLALAQGSSRNPWAGRA